MKRLLVRHTFQYRLINLITYELLVLAAIFIAINIKFGLNAMAVQLVIGSLVAVANLIILKRMQTILLCGHVISCVTLCSILFSNYWMGGLESSYMAWFIMVPIIAAATVGISGLMIYTFITIAIVFGFYSANIQPLYTLPEDILGFMSLINSLFPIIITATTLYILLGGYGRYENLLRMHNMLLRGEKQKYRYLSRYDSLTNLPNRAYFQIQIESFLNDMKKGDTYFTLFIMDLDAMKQTNDSLGHEAGDTLLLLAGKRLQSSFRGNDFVARIGGDEFTAIVSHPKDSKLSGKLAKRVLREFQKPFNINNTDVNCTISIGMAIYPDDGVTSEALFNAADHALYQVKNAGGNNYLYRGDEQESRSTS